jgi:alkylhydroperoxidase family enzyme
VRDADVDAARAAGLDDGDLGEVVAHVALNVFTNYFNSVAGTEIDFPAVRAPRVPAAAGA